MAEKEERILCSCYTGIQAELMANNNIGMTRQEAIERMVLAMHNEDIKRSIKDIPCDYRNLAEAALNALLEADNGGH